MALISTNKTTSSTVIVIKYFKVRSNVFIRTKEVLNDYQIRYALNLKTEPVSEKTQNSGAFYKEIMSAS